ncbi:allantoate permease [Penicillium malachiteum]|uniref:Allantoate permease n=1 Tax=Penicillium malachiteum TaxID=1324776 RepID=A0AAD6N1G7_9EURO|nr:allantoate permease [Penicillium malachiteum]
MTYGIITVRGSFIILWMPDTQTKAKCFSEEDKKLTIERVRKNRTAYAFAVIQFCTTIPSVALSAFSSLLIQTQLLL